MIILAIDPGPVTSGYVGWKVDGHSSVSLSGTDVPNADVLALVQEVAQGVVPGFGDCLAIEKVACYGRPVGEGVLETVHWSGRFEQAWRERTTCDVIRLRFSDVLLHHCHTRHGAKESHVRQVLIDRFGSPGTKKAPGLLYHVHGHAWSALALAVAVADQLAEVVPAPALSVPIVNQEV